MPKEKEKPSTKLASFSQLFRDEGIEKEGNNLVCKECRVVVAMTKFQIEQHIKTVKHLKNKSAKLKQKSMISMTTDFETRVPYAAELCKAFVSANIPLFKLTNPVLKNFLEKNTGQPTPDESTIRKNYVEQSYHETLEAIREAVADNAVWVSIDETMDKKGRSIANIIIGVLSENPSRPYLLKTAALEKTNHSTIAKVFNDALQLLWPAGIQHEKVLLFVTDAARYMLKAASSLQILYNKMIHVTCLAHALHRVAEVVRETFPLVDSLVSLGKQIFLKAPNRVQVFKDLCPDLKLPPKPVITRWGTWLEAVNYYSENFKAFKKVIAELENDSEAVRKAKTLVTNTQLVTQLGRIRSHYVFISEEITKLETQGVSLADSLNHLQQILTKLKNVPDAAVKDKLNMVLKNNPGLESMKAVANFDSKGIESDEILKEMSPTELLAYKFAPVVSCDVERSFSMFKKVLSDTRFNLSVKSIEMYLEIASFNPNEMTLEK